MNSTKNTCDTAPCYGLATVGEKGQIVIPSDLRTYLNIQKGEKPLLFTTGNDMLALGKLSEIEHFTTYLSKKIKTIKKDSVTKK